MAKNSFGAAAKLRAGANEYEIFRLGALEQKGVGAVSRLPFSTKILLENLLRHEDGRRVTGEDIQFVARGTAGDKEINFMPARVLLQDFTGVPAVVDLAAMRDALGVLGADPKRANPLLPADLVIDHSVQVDHFGSADSFQLNAMLEFQRNKERYVLLRWGQTAFQNFRVVPPDTGIVHQVNLEYLASVVFRGNGQAYPDSVVGTDSHTTMINGLGVLGWGVGGIEAERPAAGRARHLYPADQLSDRAARHGTAAHHAVALSRRRADRPLGRSAGGRVGTPRPAEPPTADRGGVISIRHPEARAQRASKDDGHGLGRSSFEGRFAATSG